MTSRFPMPNSSDPDPNSESLRSENQDAQIPTSIAIEHTSRSRYHPRRSSSAFNSTLPSITDGHPDPPGHGHGIYPFADMSSETRRQNIMAMDRKRRLTGSMQEEGRKRQGPGTSSEQDGSPTRMSDSPPLSSRWLTGPPRRSSSQVSASAQTNDSTNAPPVRTNHPLPPVPPTALSPASSDGLYVVPRWQPDYEVTECPICRRSFTFLFRRHHCRKCGRVVCNDCSPHRITIPRQYIVSPPGFDAASGGGARDSVHFGGQGDGDDDDNDNDDSDEDTIYSSALSRRRRRARAHHFSLGGGEKVRLCNPCVPDPQPEHQPNYASHTLPRLSGGPTHVNLPRLGLFTPTRSRDTTEPFPGMSVPTYFPTPIRQPGQRPYRNHTTTFDSLGVPPSSMSPPAGPMFESEHNYSRSGPARDHGHISHGRYHSFDQTRAGMHSNMRPRIRSMFEESNNSIRGSSAYGSHARAVPLREEDTCPVCRRALPPKGVDGDETDREAHIMSCITSRDPSASAPQNGSPGGITSPVRGPMHMLTFVATEKDCTGDDGSALECSICMVEYDVGEQLARLECLCKFHRECIVSWFERKQECPVHKIA